LDHYPKRDPIDLLRRITGIEINPISAAIAQFRLILAVTDRVGRSALDPLAEEALPRILVGDFLDRDASLPKRRYQCILGNPPYVRIEQTDAETASRLRNSYETARGKFDLSVIFFDRSIELLRQRGRLGFVTSGKFRTQKYGRPLRNLLSKSCQLETVLDLTDRFPFPGVGATPLVITLSKRDPSPEHPVQLGTRTLPHNRFSSAPWPSGHPSSEPLEALEKASSERLGDHVAWAGYEVITGLNDAFIAHSTRDILEEAGVDPEFYIPFLRPQNIQDLGISWTGQVPRKETYLLYPHDDRGNPLAKLPPSLNQLLSPHRERLEARRDWNRIPYRENPRRKWYELHQVNHIKGRPKLLILRNAQRASVLYQPRGAFIAGDRFHAYCLNEPTEENYRFFWLLLNSRLTDLWVRVRGTQIYAARPGRKAIYEYEKKFLWNLPFRFPEKKERPHWTALSKKLEEAINNNETIEPIRTEIDLLVLNSFGLETSIVRELLEDSQVDELPQEMGDSSQLSLNGLSTP
jgi:hypothetical protein